MKPWPEALAKLCPLDPRITNPERPWWRPDPDPEFTKRMAERSDGYGCRLHDRKAMESVDRNIPMPHPGFRAGQVWADETGTTVVVTRMAQGIPWFENGRGSGYIRDYPYLVADPCCPHLAPWAPAGGKP